MSKGLRKHIPAFKTKVTLEAVKGPDMVAPGNTGIMAMTESNKITEADGEAVSRNMAPPKFIFDGRNPLD